ncbi:MAG: hypothetical protein ACI9VM_000988 [Candidatus Azotimanducaceae bacterium]|jgi:hypothetical protein
MKIEQKSWTEASGWEVVKSTLDQEKPQLVLVFGGRAEVEKQEHFDTLHEWYPDSNIVMSSTAGEISGTLVRDNSLSVCAIHFEKTELAFESALILEPDTGESIGAELVDKLKKEGLRHVMVLSDGLKVNGTSLVKGITAHLPDNVSVTGGMVGDGADFKKTVVGLNAVPTSGQVVLIGFYGTDIKVGYGSLGGWDSFGPVRLITKSVHNVLYELDGKPALELYKQYLGDQADELPSSGLLFPLNLHLDEEPGGVEVVRTLLGVDEEDQSMTFAGDLPEGKSVNLMKANFDRLVDGAAGAAGMSQESLEGNIPDLAILISCIGRKLVLKERIEEETESVKKQLGGDEKTFILGFYSYGEISPVASTEKQCELHNQTMTITTFTEG